VEQCVELKVLRKASIELVGEALGVEEGDPRDDKHFHVTLAFRDVTSETLSSVEMFLQDRSLPVDGFMVDALSLFRHDADMAREDSVFRFGHG